MGLSPSPAEFRQRLLPIALAQGVGLACGLAGVSVTTKWIHPEALGRYALFLTLVPLGMLVFHAGPAKYLARHWARSGDRRALAVRATTTALRRLPWLALTVGAAAFVWARDGWLTTALFAFLAASLLSVITYALTALQAVRAHWEDCAASAVGSVTRSFLPPLFFLLAGGQAWSLMGGFVGYTAVTAFVYLLLARRHLGPKSADRPLPESGVYEGRLFLALAVGQWALQAVARWSAATWYGAEFTGLFSLAANIALIPTTMLGSIVLQYSQPKLFAADWESATARRLLATHLDRLAAVVTLMGLGGLAALHLLTPRLVGVWIAPSYTQALPWIFPAGCLALAAVLGQIFQLGLLATHQEGRCGPSDLGLSVFLIAGTLALAAVSPSSGWRLWLLAAPLWPWLWSRTWVRRWVLPSRGGAS